jgi:serine/threonine protein kinase
VDPGETRAIASPQPAAEELTPGTAVGTYVVQSLIASGGGGMVYRARHALLGRMAALKVLRREIASSQEAVARFAREAQVVNRIRHPNIVDIHEFAQLPDGRRYFVMELLDGADLLTTLKRRGRLSPAEILDILQPLCSALETAHAAGVVHRDVKASNICLAQVNGATVVKLLDFGIAKLLRPEADDLVLSTFGMRLGTPCAMAPEQIRGEPVDQRVDIYALGVLVYQLLTGRYPFSANSLQELDRLHLEASPPRPSHAAPVPASFDAVVLRCMEKEARRRFQQVGEFLQAFREAMRATASARTEPLGPVVYLEVHSEEGQEAGQEDEALLDEVCALLDLGEQALGAAGFELAFSTGSAVLGRLGGSVSRPYQHARAVGEALAGKLAERAAGHPTVWANVILHAHATGAGLSEASVLADADWIPNGRTAGLHVTSRAQQALAEEAAASPPDR